MQFFYVRCDQKQSYPCPAPFSSGMSHTCADLDDLRLFRELIRVHQQ
jgi:uncharacterized protein (DUF983 family)